MPLGKSYNCKSSVEECFKYHYGSSNLLTIVWEGVWPRPCREEAGVPKLMIGWGGVMLSEPLSPLLLHEEHTTCFFAHSFKSLCGWHLEKYRLQPDVAILMTALEIPSFSQQHLLSAPHPCHQRAFPTQVALQIERISDVHVWLPPLKALTNIQVVNNPREMLLIKLVQVFRRKQT